MEIETCSSLNEVRSNIDLIDKQIVCLLVKRGIYVKQAVNFKKKPEQIEDTKRIQQILENVKRYSEELKFDSSLITLIYQFLIKVYIKLEEDTYRDLK